MGQVAKLTFYSSIINVSIGEPAGQDEHWSRLPTSIDSARKGHPKSMTEVRAYGKWTGTSA